MRAPGRGKLSARTPLCRTHPPPVGHSRDKRRTESTAPASLGACVGRLGGEGVAPARSAFTGALRCKFFHGPFHKLAKRTLAEQTLAQRAPAARAGSPAAARPASMGDDAPAGDGDSAPVCWVCLCPGEPDRPLSAPCACPRPVHERCLARWQLQQAGREEETTCRSGGGPAVAGRPPPESSTAWDSSQARAPRRGRRAGRRRPLGTATTQPTATTTPLPRHPPPRFCNSSYGDWRAVLGPPEPGLVPAAPVMAVRRAAGAALLQNARRCARGARATAAGGPRPLSAARAAPLRNPRRARPIRFEPNQNAPNRSSTCAAACLSCA